MGELTAPKVYLVGYTAIDQDGLERYLRDSGNEDFLRSVAAARAEGLSDGEVLCSFYAKLCYASLTPGHNANVTRVRDVPDNLRACWDQGHGSVFEHAAINFVVRDCSRVLTHELVRHRAGTAFSQTSGRYVRLDSIGLVMDPVLAPAEDLVRRHVAAAEDAVYLVECRLGLRVPNPRCPGAAPDGCLLDLPVTPGQREALRWVPNPDMPMARKKKLTSAVRRLAPNGQTNEIGFSINLRALRHVVQLRTSRHAEWEIREAFGQVYRLTKGRFPLLYHGAREEEVDGLVEVSGMRMQPYERQEGQP